MGDVKAWRRYTALLESHLSRLPSKLLLALLTRRRREPNREVLVSFYSSCQMYDNDNIVVTIDMPVKGNNAGAYRIYRQSDFLYQA